MIDVDEKTIKPQQENENGKPNVKAVTPGSINKAMDSWDMVMNATDDQSIGQTGEQMAVTVLSAATAQLGSALGIFANSYQSPFVNGTYPTKTQNAMLNAVWNRMSALTGRNREGKLYLSNLVGIVTQLSLTPEEVSLYSECMEEYSFDRGKENHAFTIHVGAIEVGGVKIPAIARPTLRQNEDELRQVTEQTSPVNYTTEDGHLDPNQVKNITVFRSGKRSDLQHGPFFALIGLKGSEEQDQYIEANFKREPDPTGENDHEPDGEGSRETNASE